MGLDSRQAVADSCKNLGGSQELMELSLLDPIELEPVHSKHLFRL